MATQNPTDGLTLEAGADLSTKQHYLAKLDANGNAVLAAAGTDKIIGAIQEPNVSGRAVLLNTTGIIKVVAGGAVAIGDDITSDANGKAVATAIAGNRTIGIALAAAAANDVFEVLVRPLKL